VGATDRANDASFSSNRKKKTAPRTAPQQKQQTAKPEPTKNLNTLGRSSNALLKTQLPCLLKKNNLFTSRILNPKKTKLTISQLQKKTPKNPKNPTQPRSVLNPKPHGKPQPKKPKTPETNAFFKTSKPEPLPKENPKPKQPQRKKPQQTQPGLLLFRGPPREGISRRGGGAASGGTPPSPPSGGPVRHPRPSPTLGIERVLLAGRRAA
jgi:hypothetical protein